jgi:hypothetical protein
MKVPGISTGRVVRSAAGAVIALSLVTSAMAANADGKSASTALPLSGIANGNITGATSGAYDFYTFPYAGDGSTVTLTYTIGPLDPVTQNEVGVNIYQGGNLVATGNGAAGPEGTNSIFFSSTTPGPALVQVYDYGAGAPATFQLSLSGVSTAAPAPVASPVAAAAPVNTPVPAAAAPMSGNGTSEKPYVLKGTMTGTLTGSSAGDYTYYTFDYPGDGSFPTVQFDFTPNGPDTANGVFVNFYQNGTLLSSVQGNDNGSLPTGQVAAQFTSTVAGPILIQVANYNPAGAIGYSISH